MSNDSTPAGGGNVWTSPLVLWSGILLAVIVVAAIVVAVTSSGSSGEPVSVTNPTAAAPGDSSSDSICGLPAGDQSIPTTSAPTSTWALVGKIAAPTDEEYGPGLIRDDGLRSCYAHSPVGALYAVANAYALGTTPELAVASAENNFAAGPGRDIALESVRDEVAAGTLGATGLSIQFAGFQVLSYDSSHTTIDIVFRYSNGGVVSFVTDMVWQNGDWKVVFQDNGQPRVPGRGVPNLAGYILWSGA